MFDRIVGWVEEGGYLAIALLMLLENLFPPIPSELIMPLAGFSAAGGKFSLVGVVVAGSYVVLVMLNFAWFWPIYTDQLLTHAEWLQRIWFSRWI